MNWVLVVKLWGVTSLLLRYANSGMVEKMKTPMTAAAAAAAAAAAGLVSRLQEKPAVALTGMKATERGRVMRV
jgi:hypothetical protein